jgi:hypothetical protein
VTGVSNGINEFSAVSNSTSGFKDPLIVVIGLVFLISAIVAGIKFPSAQLNPQIERVV